MRNKKTISIVLGAIILALVGWGIQQTLGSITQDVPSVTQGTFRTYTFFASTTAQTVYATTTNATSTNITPFFDDTNTKDNGYFVVAGAKQVMFYFTRGDKLGGGNTGNSKFNVEISNDGTNWVLYNKLISNIANTNSQNLTRIATSTVTAGTSTQVYSMDLTTDAPYAVRCIVVETTDGSHECKASASW